MGFDIEFTMSSGEKRVIHRFRYSDMGLYDLHRDKNVHLWKLWKVEYELPQCCFSGDLATYAYRNLAVHHRVKRLGRGEKVLSALLHY